MPGSRCRSSVQSSILFGLLREESRAEDSHAKRKRTTQKKAGEKDGRKDCVGWTFVFVFLFFVDTTRSVDGDGTVEKEYIEKGKGRKEKRKRSQRRSDG